MERFVNPKTFKDLSIILFSTIAITLLVWIPHILSLNSFYGLNFSSGFGTIYRNFDGLEYVIIAKSLYDPQVIARLPQSLPAIYYAAHFPGYALIILIFAPIIGFLKSMLFTSLLFTVLSAISFYFLVKNFKLSSQPLFLSLIFLVLPARWLIVHSVGSAEPMFVFFVVTAIYFFMRFEETGHTINVWLASLAGVFAQFTRPPGILIFAALGIYILWNLYNQKGDLLKNFVQAIKRYHPLALIPLTLFGVFYWYSLSYGDFFAYFHTGDNIHLVFPPFKVFNIKEFWVGSIWLEDIVYVLILSLLGGLLLLKQRLIVAGLFVLTYLGASMLVAHRDISRYILPVFPFVLIAFEKVLVSREFKIVLAILLLAIYLYSQNFIIENVAPFPNLQVFD